MDKIIKIIDNVTFELKRDYDFSWLSKYGQVFCVYDQQDSGNICFGVKNKNRKVFIKYAGAPTVNYEGTVEDAILRMKKAIHVYEDIAHPNLINLVEHFKQGDGYACIYDWVDGECLHAHWNFDKYPKYSHPASPNFKFNLLTLEQKLKCIDTILNFHILVAEKEYVAIDFYDGSIMYDFKTNKTTICDIDFYHKGLFINSDGFMMGSPRFMSPEEHEKGAIIDEVSNVFTLGAITFELLGNNRTRSIEHWTGPYALFEVAKKAINKDRTERYQSIKELYTAWTSVII